VFILYLSSCCAYAETQTDIEYARMDPSWIPPAKRHHGHGSISEDYSPSAGKDPVLAPDRVPILKLLNHASN
jgi:hypothetical protein